MELYLYCSETRTLQAMTQYRSTSWNNSEIDRINTAVHINLARCMDINGHTATAC